MSKISIEYFNHDELDYYRIIIINEERKEYFGYELDKIKFPIKDKALPFIEECLSIWKKENVDVSPENIDFYYENYETKDINNIEILKYYSSNKLNPQNITTNNFKYIESTITYEKFRNLLS